MTTGFNGSNKSQGVLHGDETPVKLLQPGLGKTHQAYVWAWRTSDLCTGDKAVVFDFSKSRSGENARRMLQDYGGTLVVDDYSGYKALFAQGSVIEAGCWAHARRKFFEAHKLNRSELAKQALDRIGLLYDIERGVKDLSEEDRLLIRHTRSKPLLVEFKAWLPGQRAQLVKAGCDGAGDGLHAAPTLEISTCKLPHRRCTARRRAATLNVLTHLPKPLAPAC